MIDPRTYSAGRPVTSPTPVITVNPVIIPAPGRSVPWQVSVSVPASGGSLPVVILSHVETTVPGLSGRMDRSTVAAIGYSLGGHTIGLLSGMTTSSPDGAVVNLLDDRISARVMIAAPGGGAGLAAGALERFPELGTVNFDGMTPPALVVVGDEDHNPFFSARTDWRSDAYLESPGPKTLLIVLGAHHLFGGISGFDAEETPQENPERVALLRTMIWAYLRSELNSDDPSWTRALAVRHNSATPFAHVETKQ